MRKALYVDLSPVMSQALYVDVSPVMSQALYVDLSPVMRKALYVDLSPCGELHTLEHVLWHCSDSSDIGQNSYFQASSWRTLGKNICVEDVLAFLKK